MLNHDMLTVSENLKNTALTFVNDPELVDRYIMRQKRKELKSTHPQTREKFDQFYRDHQLLLKLFIFLGVMPLKSTPGHITFSWHSKEMIYALVFYLLTSILVVRVGYERWKILQTTHEFDEYIYAVVFIVFLVPHLWIPFVGWGVAHRVAIYKCMWAPFQIRFYRITGHKLVFPTLSRLIFILFIGCVLLSIIFLYCLSSFLDGFLLWHTTAYFHIITMINMNAALFYINSKAIQDSALSIASFFEQDMKKECTPKLISQYRILWLDLSNILQTLGSAYTRTYATYILFMGINITIGSFGALSGLIETGFSSKVVGLIVLTLYCIALLFIVCDCAERATRTVASGVQEILLSQDLRSVNMQARREIDYFILAIELNPPLVNLQGYGEINRELLTSVITIIATYLIVLLQFKLTLVKEQTKNNKS